MSEFRPRYGLLAFAETLPPWLAVWIINRETRRAERWLAEKDGRIDARYGGNALGLGGIFSGLSGFGAGQANKKAAMAQMRAAQAHQDFTAATYRQLRATAVSPCRGIE